MAIVYIYTHSRTTILCLRLVNQWGMNDPTHPHVRPLGEYLELGYFAQDYEVNFV